MLRFLTAGESHGPGLVTIIEGLPAGLAFDRRALEHELARRRHGYGRGPRMRIETDELEILGGIRHGATLGSPIAVVIRNAEWERWSTDMSPDLGEPAAKLTSPRPGHADLAGMQKYGTDDARNILERASARETAARAVVGFFARRLLAEVGVTIVSHVISIGDVTADGPPPGPDGNPAVDASPVRTLDALAAEAMVAAIDKAKRDRDTLGGVFEVVAYGVPAGIGSHVHWDRKLDGALARALMSIPAIKGVEIGAGFNGSRMPGSEAHDEITPGQPPVRQTNRAGGIEGGMSNGEPIVVRAAMKPLSTLMRPLNTVDVETGEPAQAFRERSDVCAVPAASVVGEHMVAIAICAEMQRKFGGDTLGDFSTSMNAYKARLS